ncbi:MAG: hypothetical protein SVJ22_06020, partial [Halobacteriota archaeon]|nr:hypothetical protein [Halobacteriota archaeon]
TSGYTGPDYTNGMRAMFFSDTSLNPWGYNITGIGDMTNHIPDEYWHYYYSNGVLYPAVGGFTVKYVSDIEIMSDDPVPPPPVPELNTMILMGIGILAISGSVYMSRRG